MKSGKFEIALIWILFLGYSLNYNWKNKKWIHKIRENSEGMILCQLKLLVDLTAMYTLISKMTAMNFIITMNTQWWISIMITINRFRLTIIHILIESMVRIGISMTRSMIRSKNAGMNSRSKSLAAKGEQEEAPAYRNVVKYFQLWTNFHHQPKFPVPPELGRSR